MKKQLLRTLTASILLMSTSVLAQEAPSRTECIAPAKPGGGFDLTCKLIQVSLLETGAIEKPMRVTYMPGGVGAVAYNAIVAQRPGEPGTVVAFSGGSLLNLSQGKFGRYGVDDVRWLASVGTDYGMIAVRADSPWKTLKDLMMAMEKDPNSVVIGAGASIGSQDWMKSALLAQKANVDPHKMRYVAFEGGGEPVTALMGNHVQVVSGDLSEMVPYLGGDKIRVLAVFSDKRLPASLPMSLPLKSRATTWCGQLFAAFTSDRKSAMPITSGGWTPSRNSSKPTNLKSSAICAACLSST
ncbi:tricarboxylic transport [Salmonella enterica subsp. salamae]|uniref:Tricarboxylic transport n=1 Tax=Salmonella enterica subsp. salamae TaxID=59202 RepID=A0A6D2G6F1_SALER|nr:tricarboxylic transport [Salmonella enterica subsp. salamae]